MTTTTTTTTLPEKPSDLLALALHDLSMVEGDSRYRVNMDTWHSPVWGDVCYVCLAGAVMAQSLSADPAAERLPSDYPEPTDIALSALEHLRQGRVAYALEVLGYDPPPLLPEKVYVPAYETSPGDWWDAMRGMLRALRWAGY